MRLARETGRALAFALALLLLGVKPVSADGQAAERPATLGPFLAETKSSEMALALTAAPASITSKAALMTLDRRGYQLVRVGDNGFVCLVERSWATDVTDDEFWNSRIRQPACYNREAARSVLPSYLERTRWVMAGASVHDVERRTRAGVVRGRIKPPGPGAMVYMMSKQGYLGDLLSKHPHPHLMFFLPKRDPGALGANRPGVPIFSVDGHEQPFSIFFVLVPSWSDGTPAPSQEHGAPAD